MGGVGGFGIAGTIWKTPTALAERKSSPQRLPDAVREAVERTLDATRESAQTTRSRAQEAAQTTRTRAQEAADEVVRVAEAGAGAVRERVKEAIDQSRPVTTDDLRDLRAELRAISRRLESIEERLPAKRRAGSGGSRRSGSASPAKKSGAKSRAKTK
jgi:hypothetical protein